MQIKITCAKCQKDIEVLESVISYRIKCVYCGHKFKVKKESLEISGELESESNDFIHSSTHQHSGIKSVNKSISNIRYFNLDIFVGMCLGSSLTVFVTLLILAFSNDTRLKENVFRDPLEKTSSSSSSNSRYQAPRNYQNNNEGKNSFYDEEELDKEWQQHFPNDWKNRKQKWNSEVDEFIDRLRSQQ